MSHSAAGPPLRGRHQECHVLDRLLDDVRLGAGRALVLRGEAGVGKSALLDHLRSHASGCRLARVAGVESEMELAFAGLHQLCAPMLDRLERLPAVQRDALQAAFGLTHDDPPDRFLVGLAVLSLLADAAEQGPVVCVVDDAQWLDRVSGQTLAFVARRLLAERVALVFAVREPTEDDTLGGLPELVVTGLGHGDARALLETAITGRLDGRVHDRIIAETRGNPLALLELPRDLTAAELAGGFALPDAQPVAGRIEQSFMRRLTGLPAQTRRLLLVAAAEPIGDVSLLWRAADGLGIAADAVAPAESEDLIELRARVRFRHPLVRSAAYRAATSAERREAHRALAEATDPDTDPDRRAWHRAHAATGPDEGVARQLERSAERARSRGGVAAAAAFLARAVELTPDPNRRGARALAAAQAKFDAGAPDAALALLTTAELGPLDDLQRARLELLRAQIAFARTRGRDARQLLLTAARRLEPLDAPLARETYLEALRATIFAGRLDDGDGIRDMVEAMRDAPPPPRLPRPIDLLLDGLATRFKHGYAAGVGPLRRALASFSRAARPDGDHDDMRWLWLACPVAPEPLAPDLWDDETWHDLSSRAVGLARDSGALNVLPTALTYRAVVHVHAGEFGAASGLIEEADAITRATGSTPVVYTSLLLAAYRGLEPSASDLIATGIRDAGARGEGRAIGLADHATAVLHNGLGDYEEALAAARRSCEHDDLGFYGWSLAELVEAGARGGDRDAASDALRRLGERTGACETDWARGIEARSRALLADDDRAESLYVEAIEQLGRTRMVVHLARAHLVYGEWLRRSNRRVDARTHLREAYESFSRMGAAAFAERARRELLATGETVRGRTPEARDQLTAQEAQIARLAADRHTNSEIGAQLFISPRTVEYHLRKVFMKLDISSRKELRSALDTVTRGASPPPRLRA
jgi:DNA-binding CsgD family transcriptional regulator